MAEEQHRKDRAPRDTGGNPRAEKNEQSDRREIERRRARAHELKAKNRARSMK